jgi:hypothetical protein
MFPPPCLPAFDDPPLTITHHPPARDIDGRGKSSLFTKAKTSPHGAGSDRLRSASSGHVHSPCFGNRQHGPQPPARVRAGASLTVPQLRLPRLLSPLSPFPPLPPFSCGSRRNRPRRNDRGVHAYTTTFEVCKSGEWTRLKFCSAIGVVLPEKYSMEHHSEIELCVLPTEDRRISSSTPSSLGRIGADLGK